MDAEAAVDAGAGETHEDAEFGRGLVAWSVSLCAIEMERAGEPDPLGRGGAAVDAFVVAVLLLDSLQLSDGRLAASTDGR